MKFSVVFILLLIGNSNCVLSQTPENPEWVKDQSVYTNVIDSVIAYFEGEGIHQNDIQIFRYKGHIIILKDTLPFKHGLQVSLQNIYLDYSNNNISPIAYLRQLKAKLIDEHKLADELKSFDSSKKYLKMKIYPDKFNYENLLIYDCDIISLDGILCLETNYGIKDVLSSEIQDWKVDGQTIFEQALDQTRSLFNDSIFVEMEVASGIPAQLYFDDKNYFVSSILMFPELFDKFDEGNGVLVCIPTRHCALIVPVKPNDVNNILIPVLGVNYEIYTNQPGRTSLNLFYFKDGNYSVIQPLIDEENKKVDFVLRN